MTAPNVPEIFPAPTDEDLDELCTTPATGDTIIILPSGNVSISAAAERIFTLIAKERRLFYRGGRVHEVVTDGDGIVRLSPVTPAQFRSRLEQYGRVHAWRYAKDGERMLKPAICPEETAKALLESQPAGRCLPNVALLSRCPILANNNGVPEVLSRGWHALNGGVYVVGGDTPPEVPLLEAVSAIEGLLADFDFPTPGDRSRAQASCICPAMVFGSWINGHTPIDIGEADASQSGKTYRQKLVAAIYGETPNMVVQRNGGVGGFDENLSQKLIDARPFTMLDNLRGRVDSAFLESILTAPGPMPARVPHRGEVLVDPRKFIFQMTSNGVETTRDLANRASIVRIRKRPMEFRFRSYPEGDLYDHVMANQAYYQGCVFSIIKEYVREGCPRTSEMRHDFRPWAQSLDWIVRNIFRAAPLLDGQEDAKTRVSNPGLSWLRALYISLRDAGQLSEHTASRLAEHCIENDLLPPGARPDTDEKSVPRLIGKTMAGVFKDKDEVEIDGFRVHRIHRYSQAANKEIPWYRFGEQPPSEQSAQRPPVQSDLPIPGRDDVPY